MKRFFTVLITVFYIIFYFALNGIAGELYLIKNASKTSVLPKVQTTFKDFSYILKNDDPVYGVKGAYNAVAILEQSENNLYFYIDDSNDSNLTKGILRSIKNQGLSYKKTHDNSMTMSYAQTAQALKNAQNKETKKYNFSEPSTTATTNKNNYNITNITNDPDALTGFVAQIPSGTTFDVYLQNSINTATAQNGDEVIGILTKNWIYKEHTVAEQGSKVIGYVTKANAAGMAYRDGKVKFEFNQLETTDGRVYPIKTEEIEFKVDSDGKVSSVAGRVIGGAVVGALLGLVFGALSDKNDIGKSVAIGAGIGATVGTGSAVTEQGTDAEIPIYTEMSIKLTSPLKAVLSD